MLVSREESRFDFKGARFDLSKESERKLLGWVFNQFLYGEVTGIQCGHWLYHAPHLNAAAFLAKQAGEELSHVRKILRILSLLGEKPAPAHWAVRFLSSGMMGTNWGEHVAIEMALGEGLVLGVFYAMTDTLVSNPEIHRILESATKEEERHVDFGERETLAWLEVHPRARRALLAQALVQVLVLQRLKKFVTKQVRARVGPDHGVLALFEEFYDHGLSCFEKRIERLGLAPTPLSQFSAFQKMTLLMLLPMHWLLGKLTWPKAKLTSTYLADPAVSSEELNYRPF